ncbi:hypothetical protein AVEN_253994-1 [Araneus ventricosus]|uniref:Uncharacterized protein n=1 Tax=Araneus ventricosus TaxID=182803 RepID=A0A4Y2XA46_ARAVE|nr:hypothetical protein AVEN_253994-1 [Araneus ventricosus]
MNRKWVRFIRFFNLRHSSLYPDVCRKKTEVGGLQVSVFCRRRLLKDHKKGKFSMIRLVCFGNKLGTFPPNKDEHAELAHELLVVLRQFPKRRAALQL